MSTPPVQDQTPGVWDRLGTVMILVAVGAGIFFATKGLLMFAVAMVLSATCVAFAKKGRSTLCWLAIIVAVGILIGSLPS